MVKDMYLTKGAPEIIIERCNMVEEDGELSQITEENRKRGS